MKGRVNMVLTIKVALEEANHSMGTNLLMVADKQPMTLEKHLWHLLHPCIQLQLQQETIKLQIGEQQKLEEIQGMTIEIRPSLKFKLNMEIMLVLVLDGVKLKTQNQILRLRLNGAKMKLRKKPQDGVE